MVSEEVGSLAQPQPRSMMLFTDWISVGCHSTTLSQEVLYPGYTLLHPDLSAVPRTNTALLEQDGVRMGATESQNGCCGGT